ncbi:MAG: PIN domain [Rhodobacteraceae bacterium HLUCCA12]|nr:MAG: PIN domain [Rhodobacteraceae bacterium HLUCCA12]
MTPTPPRALLDTCVLYPPILRDFLLALAARGVFQPLWSDAIAAEWLHLARRDGAADVPAILARMRARWPAGCVAPGDPALLDLPDRGDRHVLAAAIAGHAHLIVTANLRDFPPRALGPYGLHARSPNDFVMDLWLAAPSTVEHEVAALWPGLSGRALRQALKKAGLSRLGKAQEH